ncbi:hypothetical protein GUJ93_ZPchr0013g35072 [Zizania palustris]|uniref:Uncharacterized protein n=1 Tax=Zizania palustris TaxID=103762 RepID=A0A8J5X2L7_ZIZPA|nr:hypothetical protein GUJ93_ZPchr0013g35072 [Zizania palustris]
MFSHLGPPKRRLLAGFCLLSSNTESIWGTTTWQASNVQSSIGPRIPLPSSSAGVSSSMPETEEAGPSTLPPPPPPPPLPTSSELLTHLLHLYCYPCLHHHLSLLMFQQLQAYLHHLHLLLAHLLENLCQVKHYYHHLRLHHRGLCNHHP